MVKFQFWPRVGPKAKLMACAFPIQGSVCVRSWLLRRCDSLAGVIVVQRAVIWFSLAFKGKAENVMCCCPPPFSVHFYSVRRGGKCVFLGLSRLSVKEGFQVLSFLKLAFKSEWPREQHIKYCLWSMNVARGYVLFSQERVDKLRRDTWDISPLTWLN